MAAVRDEWEEMTHCDDLKNGDRRTKIIIYMLDITNNDFYKNIILGIKFDKTEMFVKH